MVDHLTGETPLFERNLRVCYWNQSETLVSIDTMRIETELKRLGNLQLVQLKRLDDPKLLPCDLLVTSALAIDEENFDPWIKGLHSRLIKQGGILVPTIIYANISTQSLRDLLKWAVGENWYFDILHPSHVESLPIRVANFLRLHDHLHEVSRMQKTMADISSKLESLEEALNIKLKENVP